MSDPAPYGMDNQVPSRRRKQILASSLNLFLLAGGTEGVPIPELSTKKE